MSTIVQKRFEIDTEGFKVQMSEMPLHRLIQEIVSNSFDEESVSNIHCDVYEDKEKRIIVHITDDGNGFIDEKDIYTLFKDSYKRSNPEQRGRFNLGEKQFLAVAEEGWVRTKNILIQFKGDSRTTTRVPDEGFTSVHGVFESDESVEKLENEMHKLLVPKNKTFYVNGHIVDQLRLVKEIKAVLPTVKSNGKNQKLVQIKRETTIKLYEKSILNEKPVIYELGIPIQEIEEDLKWHVDVRQKVPQTTSRDVISDKYLQRLYAVIIENTIDLINEDDSGSNWINDALKKTSAEISKQILEKRYGTDRVLIASTTDYRANERAIEAGCKLITGSELDADVRNNLKNTDVLKYATKEFGTDAFEFAKPVEPNQQMIWFGKVCKAVALDTIKKEITVDFVTTKETDEVAMYGYNTLTWNVRNCGGKNFFNKFSPRAIGILIHELSHDKFGNNNGQAHFSHEYLHEMERVAGLVGEKGIKHWINKIEQQQIMVKSK